VFSCFRGAFHTWNSITLLPSRKIQSFARPAAAIFAVALSVRLLHVWQIRAAPFFSALMGDSRGYDEWAQRIAAGDWLGREVFYQAPLYPYVLGVIYALAGRDLLVVRLVQIAIGSASCALLGLAAARLFSRNAGIAAGLMLAFYAPAIFFDGLLQKSVLDVFFVCLALSLITKMQTAETAEYAEKRSLFFLGLAMGALALTRENALVLIVVILAWLVLGFNGSRRDSRTPNPKSRSPKLESRIPNPESRAKRAAWFLAGLALVVAPIAMRNAYVGGGFFITTSQAGPNFFIGNNPNADGTYQSLRFGRGAPEYERQDATELAERALGRPLSPGEVSGYWTDRALAFITTHPGAWLKLMARKTALLWNATEMIDTESQESHAEWSWVLRAGAVVGHFGILVPLAVLGMAVTWPMRSRLWVFYAMIAAYAASVVLFYVFARYRYPLVPLLMLFAAAALVEIPALIRERTVPGGALMLAALGIAAIGANWPLLSKTTMRAITENNLATALQADGKFDEAAAHYRRAIELQPDYAPAYNNLGTALRASGRFDDAIAEYGRALSLRAEYPEAHYNLANALTEAGRPAEAADHFRVALQKNPGAADVHNNLGIALMRQGKTEPAIAEFRAALEAEPNSATSHRNLADALATTKKYDEAVTHFRRAAELDPSGAAHYDLGSLLLELDRPEAAIAEFRAALKAMPNSAEAHNNLGIALGMRGDLDAAIEQFEQALKIDSAFADARKNLAMAHAQRRAR
jgi:tetratricopeptide (TPR) repeat protein